MENSILLNEKIRLFNRGRIGKKLYCENEKRKTSSRTLKTFFFMLMRSNFRFSFDLKPEIEPGEMEVKASRMSDAKTGGNEKIELRNCRLG